jgi:hypothetical protein
MTEVRVPWIRSLIGAGLFFLPTGAVALAYCWSSMRAGEAGNVERAARQARVARIWSWITFVLRVLLYLVIVGALLALGAFS